MKAATLHAARQVELTDVPWPEVRSPRDAVVRVTRAAICGTDLHPYRGEIPGFRPGTVMGHELVGVVEDVGPEAELAGVAVGSRVVASDVIACGACWWCARGAHYQCTQVSLFGYGEVVGKYVPGGQAEALRIPFADTVLTPVPEGVSDDNALFVGDVLTTAWTAVVTAGIGTPDATAMSAASGVGGALGMHAVPRTQGMHSVADGAGLLGAAGDEVVAVVGCGPVGLCAVLSARLRGAGTVVAVDPQPARRAVAVDIGTSPSARAGVVDLRAPGGSPLGAGEVVAAATGAAGTVFGPPAGLADRPGPTSMDAGRVVAAGPEEARGVVDELTEGRGADRVIEAVGTSAALAAAIGLVRACGVVAAVGAHHDPAFPLDTGDAFGRELTLRWAVGDPIRWAGELFDHLAAGRLDPARLVSHRLPLDDVAEAYALFDRGEATKVLLLPDP